MGDVEGTTKMRKSNPALYDIIALLGAVGHNTVAFYDISVIFGSSSSKRIRVGISTEQQSKIGREERDPSRRSRPELPLPLPSANLPSSSFADQSPMLTVVLARLTKGIKGGFCHASFERFS